jgi:DNA end-binding protein Ku
MARKNSKSRRPSRARKKAPKRGGGRAIWKGTIDFGLVNIPVALHSAETSGGLDFALLDKRDFSRVRYRRVNENTGREVPWDDIVKGYLYKKGEYVALSDDDFARANVEATQSIAITDFVEASEISPIYCDKPYYLAPLRNGQRAYALLRETLKKLGKVGIARVVIHTREHLAALFPDDAVLVLNLLRFHDELRDPASLDLPKSGAKSAGISAQEIKMAERLVESMAGQWQPEKYRDEYRSDILKIVEEKVEAGKTKSLGAAKPAARAQQHGKVIDIMHLLRQSVKEAEKHGTSKQRKAG